MYVHRRERYARIQLALDALLLWFVWEFTAQLRILLNPLMRLQLTLPDSNGWAPPILLVLPLWLAVCWRLRLYSPPHRLNTWAVLKWAANHAIAIDSIAVLSVFFSRQVGAGASRMFVVCLLPVTFAVFAGTRAALLLAFASRRNWRRPPSIALIGDSESVKQFVLRSEPRITSAIRGVIVPEAAAAAAVGHFAPIRGTAARAVAFQSEQAENALPVLGSTRQIAEVVNRERIERVLVLNGSLSHAEFERCHRVFWRMGLPVHRTLDLPFQPDSRQFGRPRIRVDVSKHNGLSIVEVRPARLVRKQDLVKHSLDCGLAIILLAALWPVLLTISILIRLTSDGPAMERLWRVGKGGRHFPCFKFRTTYRENDPKLPRSRTKKTGRFDQDTYLTPVGLFLRRYTLDELPQLLNILRGEMSFVGPRPLPAQDFGPDGMSREFFDWSDARARVRPGLTGLWQVSGRRNLSFDEMIGLDLEYIQTRSLWGDAWILLRTPVPVLRGVGAR